MPCSDNWGRDQYDSRLSEDNQRLRAELRATKNDNNILLEMNAALQKRLDETEPSYDGKLKERIDSVTQFACEMGNLLHKANMLSMLTPKTLLWIAEHRVWDEERLEKEKQEQK